MILQRALSTCCGRIAFNVIEHPCDVITRDAGFGHSRGARPQRGSRVGVPRAPVRGHPLRVRFADVTNKRRGLIRERRGVTSKFRKAISEFRNVINQVREDVSRVRRATSVTRTRLRSLRPPDWRVSA